MLNSTILPGRYMLLANNTPLHANILSCLLLNEQEPLLYAILNGLRYTIRVTEQNWIIAPESPLLKSQIVSLPLSSPDNSTTPVEIRSAQLFPSVGLPELPNGILRIECDDLVFCGLNYYYDSNDDLVFRFRDDWRIILNKNNELIEGDRVHRVRKLYWQPLV